MAPVVTPRRPPHRLLHGSSRDLSAAAAGHGAAVRGVPVRFPGQCQVPLPRSQAVLADLVHDHLLLKSNRARMALPQNSAHFPVGYCSTASPDDLEVRLKQLTSDTYADDLYQSPRGGHRQGARCDALSGRCDRAGSALRKVASSDPGCSPTGRDRTRLMTSKR